MDRNKLPTKHALRIAVGRMMLVLLIIYIFSIMAIAASADNDKWITSSKIIDKISQSSVDKDEQDVIIGFKDISGEEAIDMVHIRGGRVKRVLRPIKALSSRLSSKEIEKLKNNPNIRYIEPNEKIYISSQSVPWGITRINAVPVHSTYNGTGVIVAVIDTGIDYLHPDLANNYMGGYDYVNEDNDPMDDHGHGTHVSGTIVAEDNEIGVIGVAPGAQIYAVKSIDSNGIGFSDDGIAAIYDSADNGAQVISMSWGGSDSQALHDAISYAYNKGAVLVAAAGNDYGGMIIYPAAYPEVIAVTATDIADGIASFSNIGADAELSAPGVNIYSTIPGGSYGYGDGTSMATPHVSGVAALVISSNLSMTNADVREYMQKYAIDLGSPGRDMYYGYGIVDANGAVFHPDIFPPESITNLVSTNRGSSYINWTWTDSVGLDFDKVMIYLNGTFQTNVTNGTQYYNAVGLTPNMMYEISTRTVDVAGNINNTWKNDTATTAPLFKVLASGQLYYGSSSWTSHFRVGNYGTQNTNTTFYDPSGTQINSTTTSIPRYASANYEWKDYAPGVSDGTALINSPEPVSVLTFQRMNTDGKLGFWEGIPLNTESTEVFVSGLLYYPGGGWRTGVKVLNEEDTPATVTMYFYNSAGTQINSITRTIQPKASPYFDWYTYGYNVAGGSADGTMKAVSDRKIHVIASQAIETNGKVGFWEGIPLNTDNTQVFVSGLVYYPGGGWRSGLKVANYNDSAASVTINFYNSGGGLANTVTTTIAPRSSPYFDWYTYGYNVPGGSADGTAVVVSDRPVKIVASQAIETIGIVDFYQAPEMSGNNTAYVVYQVFDGVERSGIKVANPATSAISADITFYDQNGGYINSITETIDAKTSPYYPWVTYAPGVVSGSVVVEATGRIVVVASIAGEQPGKLGIFRGVNI